MFSVKYLGLDSIAITKVIQLNNQISLANQMVYILKSKLY